MKLHTEKAYVGWYATHDEYDGAPDSEPSPTNYVGWGKTESEAIEDWKRNMEES